MKTFNVYPKEGEMLSMEFERFELKEDAFVLYDSGDEAGYGYLAYSHIAAIVPDEQPRPDQGNVDFHVHLRNRKDPLAIVAGHYKADKATATLMFYSVTQGGLTCLLTDVYVLQAEVVAIVPPSRLRKLS